MIWYDIVILGILLWTTWQGAARGLISQLAWVVALVLCFKFADKLAPSVEPMIGVEQPLRHWIAMFILYLGFSLVSFGAARILHGWVEQAKFKDFDRHLGGLLGLMKGVVISLVMTFFAITLSESLRATVITSQTGYVATQILDNIRPMIPEDAHPLIRDSLNKYRNRLSPNGTVTGDEAPLWSGTDSAPGTDLIGSNGANSSTAGSFEDMLRSLPAGLARDMAGTLQDAWRRATPEQRQGVLNQLGQAWQDEKPGIASQFIEAVMGQGGVSGTNSAGSGTAVGIAESDMGILNQIVQIYGPGEAWLQRVRGILNQLPSDVNSRVLRDWHADLMELRPDPEPRTSIISRIEDRVLLQLDKAGISISQLPPTLQQELGGRSF